MPVHVEKTSHVTIIIKYNGNRLYCLSYALRQDNNEMCMRQTYSCKVLYAIVEVTKGNLQVTLQVSQ